MEMASKPKRLSSSSKIKSQLLPSFSLNLALLDRGKAKTSWTVYESRTQSSQSTGARTHSESIPYSAEIVYLDLQMCVWQSPQSTNQILPAGLHDFPFTFTLPAHCPPSFEGTVGFIRYCCKAKIDRPWKFDDTTRCSFTVMPMFDLNTIHYASLPVQKEVTKNIGVLCFKHGRITARISLAKSGYVPGESVILSVDITNSSSKDVHKVETSLIETATYTAERHGREFWCSKFCHLSKDACDSPVVPSFNVCPIITVDYTFKVKIVAKGTLSNTMSGQLPVLIGTIPVRQISLLDNHQVPSQDYLAPPQPSAPQGSPDGPPPTYADSVFGGGTMSEENDEKGAAMEIFRIELDSASGCFILGKLYLADVTGKAKTSWTVYESRTQSSQSTGARTHSESIPYSAEIVYLDLQMCVWQSPQSTNQILPAGLHDFPFTFTLPAHCPPSFEGTVGFIRYCCKAKIDRPWKFDDTTRCSFTVMPMFDLNTIHYASLPVQKEVTKNIGVLCFKHGRITARISLAKSGYVPGESVILSVDITNSSSKDVHKVETSLIETATYTAERHGRLLDMRAGVGHRHSSTEKKQEPRTVVQYIEEFKVGAQSSAIYQRMLVSSKSDSPVVPSFNVCPIITVDYTFKVKIVAKGTLSNTMSGQLPVLIGTIPVRQISLLDNHQVPSQDYLAPPQPSAPQGSPDGPPPTYADSVFGGGTMSEENDEKGAGFTPKYPFYKNI
uniref:Arrestin C-terminal-like domain-containing protein n=1 Tax=Ditylenchus dipsaci TaxID=166011 RepID=A0A915DP86_9BILA